MLKSDVTTALQYALITIALIGY